MSHVTKIEFKVTDLPALREAAEACGLEFKENQKTCRGYDRNHPAVCDHVLAVPKNHDAYEIGVVAKDGEFELQCDFWQGGRGLVEKVGPEASKLKQAYTQCKVVKEMKAKGFNLAEAVTLASGDVELKLTNNAVSL